MLRFSILKYTSSFLVAVKDLASMLDIGMNVNIKDDYGCVISLFLYKIFIRIDTSLPRMQRGR